MFPTWSHGDPLFFSEEMYLDEDELQLGLATVARIMSTS
jgi:hypothetical protein